MIAVGGSGTETELVAYDPNVDSWSEQTPEPSGGNITTAASVANGMLYVLIQTGNPSPSGSPTIAFTPTASPTQLLIGLTNTVANLNILSGIANSLDAKLLAAQSSLAGAKANNVNTACNQVSAFINAVSAQSGKQITAVQANQLIDQANAIRLLLACP